MGDDVVQASARAIARTGSAAETPSRTGSQRGHAPGAHEAQRFEVRLDVRARSVVEHLPVSQQQHVVEQSQHFRRWLLQRDDHRLSLLSGQAALGVHHVEGGRAVQARRDIVHERHRVGSEGHLARRHALLLASRDASTALVAHDGALTAGQAEFTRDSHRVALPAEIRGRERQRIIERRRLGHGADGSRVGVDGAALEGEVQRLLDGHHGQVRVQLGHVRHALRELCLEFLPTQAVVRHLAVHSHALRAHVESAA